MVFGITPTLYVKAGSVIFGVYGVQMLLVPQKMVTDHFDAAPTKYTDFWIRGQSATLASLIYCLQNMEAKAAAKAMLLLSAGIAVLYPFNAKFGYLSQLEVKCARVLLIHPAVSCSSGGPPSLTRARRCACLPVLCRPNALRAGGPHGRHDHRRRPCPQVNVVLHGGKERAGSPSLLC